MNSAQKESVAFRKKFLNEAKNGKNVAELCRKFNISRQTYYKWKARYAQENTVKSSTRGKKATNKDSLKKVIRDVIKNNPEWHVGKIYEYIKMSLSETTVSRAWIQRYLQEVNLNTVRTRRIYAANVTRIYTDDDIRSERAGVFIPAQEKIAISYADSSPPKTNNEKEKYSDENIDKIIKIAKIAILYSRYYFNKANNSFASFLLQKFNVNYPKENSKYYLATIFSAITFASITEKIITVIISAESTTQAIGYILSWIALTCGSFFFLYSMKYYIITAGVMLRSLFAKQVRGLEFDPLTTHERSKEITLKRYPFFSIQIPLYNEKHVANRVVAAAVNQDYPNFEVIVCDDSTDETTALLQTKWGKHPKVKILHRESRSGFKGAALANALNYTDKRTEYVVIFDADFVPYPDTLTQFARQFQVIHSEERERGLKSHIAALQGYQWHVLNKSESWITKAVRTEFSGSYIIERTATQMLGLFRQIAGSVYAIKIDALRHAGWGTSITEDFQLTLKLYEKGYKVAYTPYIQAPSECVSTMKRIIKQRQRWAEGHSYNIKLHIKNLLLSPNLSVKEKLEVIYLAPYYLQSLIFLIGTICWIISETVLRTHLPFWTYVLGWSLVITNLFALPLMNAVGLFLEEGEERDYLGIFSFVSLSYLLAPYIGFAALKGFLEKEEGPWFRTPKTGRITDKFERKEQSARFSKFIKRFQKPTIPSVATRTSVAAPVYIEKKRLFSLSTNVIRRRNRFIGNSAIALLLAITTTITSLAAHIPSINAQSSEKYSAKTIGQTKQSDTTEGQKVEGGEEIFLPRTIQKTTLGGQIIEFIFSSDARVRIKLGQYEYEVKTEKIGGKTITPKRAMIYNNREVIYENILEGIDLKYSFTGDLLVEDYIVKTKEAAKKVTQITQSASTIHLDVVSPEPSAFGLYTDEGKEMFNFTPAFAKDSSGVRTDDVHITMEKAAEGYVLKKNFTEESYAWLTDEARTFPITIDPSVVVTGGIVEAETQFGGLQRKVAFVNGNFYAFYNDAAGINYKKSSDGISWGAAVPLDTDTDNYNPSISVSGNTIVAFWVDDGVNGTDTADSFQGRIIDTANSDTQGTMCTSADLGTLDNTNFVTVAAVSGSEAVVSVTDSSTDTEFNLYDITSLNGTCALGTDLTPGNANAGSGITAGDRPVLVNINNTDVAAIFQDGNLSYSLLDVGADDWTTNNLTIAAVTDTVYSAVTDGTKLWVLSVSGTTATNFYSCCTTNFAKTEIDADAGGSGNDATNRVKMVCPSADNCKFVYTDDLDTSSPALKFVDCNDSSCSSPTITTLDSDIGAAGDPTSPGIYCVASDNCKVVYGDDMDTATPLVKVIDCGNEDCSTNSTGTVDTDIGSSTSSLAASIWCPADTNCKVVYNDSGLGDIFFVDCSAADCSTTDAITTLNANIGTYGKNDLYCVSSTNCKVIYHDMTASDLTFVDCSTEACANTQVDIDATVGTGAGQVPVAIDCIGGDTDCKVLYGDQAAGDTFFVDCGALDCGTTGRTITTIDIAGGANASSSTSNDLSCPSATTCQFTYVGNLTSGNEEMYFVYCNGSATCAAASYQVQEIPDARFKATLVCLTTTTCKIVYYEGTNATEPTVQFATCSVANCFPSATTETAPWTGQTNVTSVSLTYDSGGNNIYAHILKDASEQAYYNSTSASSISWAGQTSWAFTAGDLGHISAVETVYDANLVSVVVRQGTNFEFATLPEYSLLLILFIPYIYRVMRRKRLRKKD